MLLQCGSMQYRVVACYYGAVSCYLHCGIMRLQCDKEGTVGPMKARKAGLHPNRGAQHTTHQKGAISAQADGSCSTYRYLPAVLEGPRTRDHCTTKFTIWAESRLKGLLTKRVFSVVLYGIT